MTSPVNWLTSFSRDVDFPDKLDFSNTVQLIADLLGNIGPFSCGKKKFVIQDVYYLLGTVKK